MDRAFDPRAILESLQRLEVDYVLIGALGALFHGSPLRTNDADICPALNPGNLERLAAALVEMKARLRTSDSLEGVEFQCDAEALGRTDIWALVTRFGDLDISFIPSGTQGFDDLKRGAVVVRFEGIDVRVASLLDIIRSKEAAGRAKDRAVLPLLREMLDRFGEHP
ncbi:MAG: hypothetical protein ACRDJ2_00260 [Actinomycetota bacterium]